MARSGEESTLRKYSTGADARSRAILEVLAGRQTVSGAAAELGVTRQTVHNWRAAFVAAGSAAITPGGQELDADACTDRSSAHLESTVVAIVTRLRHVEPTDELDIATLEAVRTGSGLPVNRFCELTGIPRRTYYARRAAPADAPKPPTRLDDALAGVRSRYPDWGARRVWRHISDVDGIDVSLATVKRAIARRS